MWVKLDDRKSGSTPILRAWRARRSPLGLHYLAELHAGAHETDGAIDLEQVAQWCPSLPERRRFTAVLIDAGLWTEREGGWQIVGFCDTNPTSAEMVLRRAFDAKRKAIERNPSLRRAVRVRDHGCCRHCGDPVPCDPQRNGDGAGGTFSILDPAGPVSIGNVVVCCARCKRLKGHLSIEQAGLALLPEPFTPLTLGPRGLASDIKRVSAHPDPTRPDPTREGL